MSVKLEKFSILSKGFDDFVDLTLKIQNVVSSFGIKEGLVNIIIYHVPYNWQGFSRMGFDIQLSGHTHGGQFYPVINFADLIFKYNRGLFKNTLGKYLHVTTGVGSMDTPMRWGTDSELVILKLKNK